jgi:putative dehydrogenase
MSAPLRIAVLGLGDAGLQLASDLVAAGADVIAFDLKPPKKCPIPLAESVVEAVSDADVVISLNSSTQAWRMAQNSSPQLKAGALYADLNMGTPALKAQLASTFTEGTFVDVAVIKPVADLGLSAPMLAAGPQAATLRDLLTPLGANIQVVSVVVGDAAARQLVHNMLVKNMAGVVVDYMWAAQAMGVTDWAYQALQVEFEGMTSETAKSYLVETVSNAKRLEIEMTDIVETLESVEYPSMFVPQTQLVYNKTYHSIKVPYSEPEDD